MRRSRTRRGPAGERGAMRVAVAADEVTPVAREVVDALNEAGHQVDLDDLDGVQTFYNYNGNSFDVMAESCTGWPTRAQADGPDLEAGKYLIFHTRAHLYLYWGNNEPSRPEGCVAIYTQAALELNKWENNQRVGVVGNYGVDNASYERDSTGTEWHEIWLHVWEDVAHQYSGMQYRLMIYVIGGWIDGDQVKHPDPAGGVTTYTYYKVT